MSYHEPAGRLRLAVSSMGMVMLASWASPAAAQQWEIEIHGGGIWASTPTGGDSRLPGPGATFISLAGTPSRRQSSWYLGDGATLFNQVAPLVRISARITPLDPLLTAAALERGNRGSFGLRLGRRISARLGAELNVDYNLGRLRMSSASMAGLEATRSSFIPAWNGFLATGPFTDRAVTSEATIRDRGGRQLLASAALDVNLKTAGRLLPYVALGVGWLSNRGDAPAAALVGNYRFRIAIPVPGTLVTPMSETDSVTVRFSAASHSLVGVLGAGVKCNVSGRWGLRVDVREHLSSNKARTLLDTSPMLADLAPRGGIALGTTPGLQFMNPAIPLPSTLSGPPITSFETFTGKGTQRHLSLAGGVFVRL